MNLSETIARAASDGTFPTPSTLQAWAQRAAALESRCVAMSDALASAADDDRRERTTTAIGRFVDEVSAARHMQHGKPQALPVIPQGPLHWRS